MTRIHRFLAMLLLFCLSFQVAASTLTELCRFECEKASQSELIKIGSLSKGSFVSKPEQKIGKVTWTAQRDYQAQSGMSCEGCSSCQECMPNIALLPFFNPQLLLFNEQLESLKMGSVSQGEPERPYKPPRRIHT